MNGRRVRRIAMWVFLSSLLSSIAAPLLAQGDRIDYLVRLLRTSDAFRVRAQAALSLGSASPEPRVVEALTEALRGDTESAVRVAAASALERLADPSAVEALRAAERDSEPAVREAAQRAIAAIERARRPGGSTAGGITATTGAAATGTPGGTTGTPRYYVGVGTPGTKVAALDPSVLRSARSFIESRVRQIEGVVIAPETETPRQAQKVLRDRSLVGFYLDSSIVSIDVRADGSVRAQVSVMVQTYPDRNVRSMLSGAATVIGESGAAAQRAAIEGALTSALRNLSAAMAASSGR
jgi:hypothetical protein